MHGVSVGLNPASDIATTASSCRGLACKMKTLRPRSSLRLSLSFWARNQASPSGSHTIPCANWFSNISSSTLSIDSSVQPECPQVSTW